MNKNIINVIDGVTHTDARYGSVVALDIPGAVPLHKLDVAYAIVRPFAVSPAHFHELTEEIYSITKGDAIMTIDGVSTPVKPGDVIRIPIYTVHSIQAAESGVEFWVVTSPPYCVDDDIETDATRVERPVVVNDTIQAKLKIAVIAGTTRRRSISAKVSRQICDFYAGLGIATDLVDLAELSPEIFSPESYEHRYETDSPLAQRLISASGIHVITPEYNGSFPGVLKHVLDVLPYTECFQYKPISFVGVAAGQWGALRAVEQLQQVFGYRNAFVFPKRVFIRDVEDLKFDNLGRIVDSETVGRLHEQINGFVEFVRCLESVRR